QFVHCFDRIHSHRIAELRSREVGGTLNVNFTLVMIRVDRDEIFRQLRRCKFVTRLRISVARRDAAEGNSSLAECRHFDDTLHSTVSIYHTNILLHRLPHSIAYRQFFSVHRASYRTLPFDPIEQLRQQMI
ncbi:hypothetical protein PFISCL1PPCAC_15833, partial [Pristionchus fissidentatus]